MLMLVNCGNVFLMVMVKSIFLLYHFYQSCYRDLSNALETKTFTIGLEIKTKTLVRGLESIGPKNYFEEND